jgi:hypothetical protein
MLNSDPRNHGLRNTKTPLQTALRGSHESFARNKTDSLHPTTVMTIRR